MGGMQRVRIPKPGTVEHASEAAFLATSPTKGMHAVRVGTEWIDLSYIDHGADTTLVCFHSALMDRSATVPVFSGRGIAEQAGMNVISVADPAMATGDVDLGWFLGTRGMGDLRPRLVPLIRHLLAGRRAVLFGASGGGYAAALYGQHFPGHAVLAVNPRLDLTTPPTPRLGAYLAAAHRATTAPRARRAREKYVPLRLRDVYADGLGFDLHLVQNVNDRVFYRHQFAPFVEELASDPRLHAHTYDGRVGHSAITPEELVPLLRGAALTVTT